MKTGSPPPEVRFLEIFRNNIIAAQVFLTPLSLFLKITQASKFAIPSIEKGKVHASDILLM